MLVQITEALLMTQTKKFW